MIGETFGSYRVVSKLGEGGMGAVYLAEHTLLGRTAALKVLLPEHSRNQDLVNRFFNEAKLAAGLKHPAIVEVFDYGVHPASGSAYIVMDYLEGESLGQRLARVAPMAPESAIDIARQIARAMEVAHARGIVHRDLKPDNVFVVPHPEDPTREMVKILDFGIAKLLASAAGSGSSSKSATRTGMVLGTPVFMAPEQCRGAGEVDHRADIYSLGCILYLMLCGRPPFDYDGLGELLGAHLHEPVTPPRERNPEVGEPLDGIVMRTLEKKPEERYQTMAELAADLGRLLPTHSGIGMAAPPPRASVTGTRIAGPEQQITLPVPPPQAAPALARSVPLAHSPTTFAGAAGTQSSLVPARSSRRPLVIAVALAFAAGLGVAAFALLSRKPVPAVVPRPTVAQTPPRPQAPPPVLPRPQAPPPATPSPTPAPEPAAPPIVAPKRERAAVTRPEPAPRPRPIAVNKSEEDAFARGSQLLARGAEREALDSYRIYLRRDDAPPARRQEAERQVLALQRKFAEIEVMCEVKGAAVFVDGQFQGFTPLPRPIIVTVGTHRLTVSKDGYKPVFRNVSLSPGGRQPVKITFQ